jgi:hypothetical protein
MRTKDELEKVTKAAADAAIAYEAAAITADRVVALGASIRKTQGRIPLDLLDSIALAQARAAQMGIIAHRLKRAVACPRRSDAHGERL